MPIEANTRQALLESARDIYLREGLSGLSMRKVAQTIGVSATAIYRHFQNKEALIEAVCEEAAQLFVQYLWQGLRGKTPKERLEWTGMGYMRFGLERSPYYRILFMSPVEDLGYSHISEAFQAKLSPGFQFLTDRVRECIDEGSLIPVDPTELAATIWAHSHGMVSLYLCDYMKKILRNDKEFEDFYRRASRRFLVQFTP